MRCLFLGGVLFALSSPALAHKVPWNAADPAFAALRENNQPALAYQLARFCYLLNRDPKACAEALAQKEGVKAQAAAALCMQRWTELDPDLQRIMHKIDPLNKVDPEACRNNANCYWHENYENQSGKTGWGVHRHEYSPQLRTAIAREYSMAYLAQYVKNYNGGKTENTTTAGSRTGAEMAAKTGGLLSAAAGEASMGVSHDQTAGQEVKNSQEGPSREERDRVQQEAYQLAYADPQSYSDRAPDVLCEKGEANCKHPRAGDYPNRDMVTSPAPAPEPPAPSTPPTEPAPTCTQVTVCVDDDFFPYDPDKITTSPEPLWLAQQLDGCVEKALAPDLTIETTQPETPPDTRPLKAIAEEKLGQGVCLREYYGDAYCNQFELMSIANTLPSTENKIQKMQDLKTWIDVDEPSSEEDLVVYCAWLEEQLERQKAAAQKKAAAYNIISGTSDPDPPSGSYWDSYQQYCQ